MNTPAFPTPDYYDEKLISVIPGMTLRDYFAAQALVATIREFWGEHDGPNEIAKCTYQIADAMLAERAK